MGKIFREYLHTWRCLRRAMVTAIHKLAWHSTSMVTVKDVVYWTFLFRANSDNLSENDVELYKSKMLFYLTLALIRGFYYGSHNLYMFTNKICSKSDEPIQTIYHGIQKELFDGLRNLAQNLTIKANWISLTVSNIAHASIAMKLF
jgi:hypothetical protein